MNSALLGAISSGIFALLGIILGWALNWVTSQRQEWKRASQVRQSVRLLLRLECRQNIVALLAYWDSVASEGVHLPGVGMLAELSTSIEEGDFDKRQRLALQPLPVWRNLMWKSHASVVATALAPVEIDRVYTLYAALETFTARRAELRQAFDAPKGKELAEDYSRWMHARRNQQAHPTPGYQEEHGIDLKLGTFNEQTRSFWNECKAARDWAYAYRDTDLIAEDASISEVQRAKH